VGCPIGNNGRIELSYLINFFVGDQPIIQREMEGCDEVSLKEVKDTVLLLAKQMVELKAAMGQSEEICIVSLKLRNHPKYSSHVGGILLGKENFLRSCLDR